MIALITMTGARPVQFDLCQKYMKRQTYDGDVVWVIIDDALPVSTNIVGENFRDKWAIHKVCPLPKWSPGQNTQARNIKAGIKKLFEICSPEDVKLIFIIEDDDYYKPEYLKEMINRLGNYYLIGESNTIYYNVLFRAYAANNNFQHSSLFQSAFTPDALSDFESTYGNKFIDAALWQKVKNQHLFSAGILSIGMKGMPGRAGIGAGHGRNLCMINDISMGYLQNLIGKEDAQQYEGYYRGGRSAQYPLLTGRRR